LGVFEETDRRLPRKLTREDDVDMEQDPSSNEVDRLLARPTRRR
jgi:hypothetical protein